MAYGGTTVSRVGTVRADAIDRDTWNELINHSHDQHQYTHAAHSLTHTLCHTTPTHSLLHRPSQRHSTVKHIITQDQRILLLHNHFNVWLVWFVMLLSM